MRSTALILSLFALAFSACDSDDDDDGPDRVPVTPEEATASSTQNLESTLNALIDRAELLSQSEMGRQAEEAMEGDDDCAYVEGDVEYGGCDEAMSFADGIAELREGVREIVRFAEESILAEGNIEACEGDTPSQAATPSNAPGIVADDDEYDDEEGGLDCAQLLEQVPLRIRVTSPREGDVDITLLVGEARLEPITLGVHRDGLRLSADLGDIARSAQLILDAEGEGETVPITASGTVSVGLTLSAQTLTFSAEAGRVSLLVEEDDGRVEFTLDPSKISVGMTPQGDGVDIAINYDMGAIAMQSPLAMMGASETCEMGPSGVESCQEGPGPEGDFRLEMAALAARLALPASGDALEISGLRVGAGGIKAFADGATILSLASILPERIDVSLAEELARIAFSGPFGVDFVSTESAMDSALGQEPDTADDAALHIHLEGAAPVLEIAEQIKVVAGKLRISGTGLDAELVAEAGMCVGGDDTAESSAPVPYPEDGSYEDYEDEENMSLEGLELVACE